MDLESHRQFLRTERRVMESLEDRLLLTVSLDSNGFTVYTPSPGVATNIIYVDSGPAGSDASSGASPSSPVRTIAHARSLLVSTPNIVNELLLRRGDVFYDNLENWQTSGLSAQDPCVIGSYSPAGDLTSARPLLYTGASADGFSTPILSSKLVAGGVNYVDLIGIAFEDQYRDPSLATFDSTQDVYGVTPNGGNYGFRSIGTASNFVVEDCSFQFYIDNIAVQQYYGPVSNFTFRHNYIAYSWAAGSSQYGPTTNTQATKSEGLYAQTVNGLTLDSNDFEHNGWSEVIPNAGANLYNHDSYIYADNTNVTIVNNIFADASSHGLQCRSGGIVENNLFLNNAIAMSFGLVNGATVTPGGVSGVVSGNIVIGDKDISGSSRGWGLEIANLSPNATTVVQNNIFAQDQEDAFPAIQVSWGTGNSNQSAQVGINNLTIQNNTIWGWGQSLSINQYFQPGTTGVTALNNLQILNNDFQGNLQSTIIQDLPASLAQQTWSGNSYDSTAGSTGWFQLASGAPLNFGQWQSSEEPTARMVRLSYPNPNRSPASYSAAQGGAGTLQSFLNAEALQSRLYYSPAYSVSAVVSYFRGGYALTGPTVAVNAPNVVAGGPAKHLFTLTYTDSLGINPVSLGDGNVLVTQPNGLVQPAKFLSDTISGNGTTAIATYCISAPDGAWSPADNGAYIVALAANQVADGQGNFVAAGIVGNFTASITDAVPTAQESAANITTGGLASQTITIAYQDPDGPGIGLASVGAGNIYVTGPNGYQQMATYVSSAFNSNGSLQSATYTITPSDSTWTAGDDGLYTICVPAAGQAVGGGTGSPVTDTATPPVAVPADSIGSFTVGVPSDTMPPTASANGAVVAASAAAGAAETLVVQYSDNVDVDATTLASSNLIVIGPKGFDEPVTLISPIGDTTPAAAITATYEVAAPAGGWAPAGNGIYYIIEQANQVADTSGNSVLPGAIGTFSVNIDNLAPMLQVSVAPITSTGNASQTIGVIYTDTSGVNLSTLANTNLLVTGPNGFSSPVTLSGYTLPSTQSNVSGLATPVNATYSLAPPTGGWSAAANGTYSVVMQANQVADGAPTPNFVPGGTIATFTVGLPAVSAAFGSVAVLSYAPVNQVTVTFSEPVTGVSLSSFAFANGYVANLLSNAQTVSTTDNQTYVLSNLTPLTSASGHYTITLAASSKIRDVYGNSLVNGTHVSFSVSIIPSVSIVSVSPNPTSTPVYQAAINFNEPISGFNLASISLTNNGSANLLTAAQTLASTDSQHFLLGNLNAITTANGNYQLSVPASASIGDILGNTLSTGATSVFTVAIPPTAAFAAVTPNPSSTPVDQVSVTFSAPVTGVTPSAFAIANGAVPITLSSAQTLSSADNKTFVLGNLTPLTSASGHYTVTLAANANIRDGYGNALSSAAAVTFSVSITQTVSIAAISPNPTNTPVCLVAVNFSVPVYGFTLADLSLTNSGGPNLIDAASSLATLNSQNFVLTLPSSYTAGGGNFTLTVNPAGIADIYGNPLAGGTSTVFTVISPTFAVNDGSAQRSMINSLTITFGSPVSIGTNAVSLTQAALPDGTAGGGAVPITLTPVNAIGNAASSWIVNFVNGGVPLNFTSLPDGSYTLSVNGSLVVGSSGAALGGTINFSFFRLFGDVNGDGVVNNLDVTHVQRSYGTASTSPDYDAALDYNGDGYINNLDINQFRQRYGTGITNGTNGNRLPSAKRMFR